MKKFTLFGAIALMASGAFVSCSSDNEFDDIETINVSEAQFPYDSDGVWKNNDKPGFLNIDDYEFSHIIDDYGMIYGFTPSKVSDINKHDPLYEFPYASVSGGGVAGEGSQYLVGYWAEFLEGENCEFNNRTCRIYPEDGDRFQPQSVMVCNNTYLMYAAIDGTAYSPAFEPGDYVTLTAHGVHLDGTEAEVTFDLINIEGSDVKDGILTSWKKFDLRGLGTCTGIYFTMDASKSLKGDFGLNVPTYFCIDQLVVKD